MDFDTMAEILKLVKTNVSKDAVDILEQLLKEAKEGNIIAVGAAIVRPNGYVCSATSETEHVAQMLGAMELLKYRFISEAVERTDEP
jgi:hypothetical protein